MDVNVSSDELRSILWSITDDDMQKYRDNASKKSKSKKNHERERKKQFKQKVLEFDDEEEVEYCSPVTCGYKSQLRIEADIDTYAKNVTDQIRQVCGVRYTNDGILHNLGYQPPPNSTLFVNTNVDIENMTNSADGNSKIPPLHEILRLGKKNKFKIDLNNDKDFPALNH